jgi:DNA adenine methylase
MRYVGGKSRIAKEIAAVINPAGLWWDAFCGGLSVSCALASYHSEGVVSDCNAALITLYQSVDRGWQPPKQITPELYKTGLTLSDDDPLKAYLGFGCSFRAKWFGGLDTLRKVVSRTHPNGMSQNPAEATYKSITRDLRKLSRCTITQLDFFDIEPGAIEFECIYLDPPYQGTQSYGSNSSPFPHERFWTQAAQWALYTRVFVSELSCPLPQAEAVWEKSCEKRLGASGQENGKRRERLFRLHA